MRRWTRFSVRTLLLAVTLLCVWLGWQAYIVRERKELRTLIQNRGGWIDQSVNDDPFLDDTGIVPLPPDLPMVRQWLGDENVHRIILIGDAVTVGERARIERAFPEAVIRPAD
jgi:hypothetical protein